MILRWCTVHESKVIRPENDPDEFWLCETSNLTGDRINCVVIEVEVVPT